MERILCTFPWYYTMTGGYCVTARVEVQFRDAIDGEAMAKALEITMSRYPYLKKRLVRTPFRFYLVPNNLPVVLKATDKPVNVGGKDANYHQFALSYSGRSLYMNQNHAIFDGRGSYRLYATLFYYYCLYHYGEECRIPNLNLAGSDINPDEYLEPFYKPLPKPAVTLKNSDRLKRAFKIEEQGLVTHSQMCYRRVKINERELMKLCKSSDASPNTALSVLLCRAIRKLHPNSDRSIVSSIFCDTRAAINAGLSHYSLAVPLCMSYDNKMDSMDFSEQNTIFRGKLMILSDSDTLLRKQRYMQRLYRILNMLPLRCLKMLSGRIGRFLSYKTCTFTISYARNSSYGDCDRHLALYSPLLYIPDSGLALEISTVDDSFLITWMQEWPEDLYFDAFLREFESIGLGYELLDRGPIEPCRFIIE